MTRTSDRAWRCAYVLCRAREKEGEERARGSRGGGRGPCNDRHLHVQMWQYETFIHFGYITVDIIGCVDGKYEHNSTKATCRDFAKISLSVGATLVVPPTTTPAPFSLSLMTRITHFLSLSSAWSPVHSPRAIRVYTYLHLYLSLSISFSAHSLPLPHSSPWRWPFSLVVPNPFGSSRPLRSSPPPRCPPLPVSL